MPQYLSTDPNAGTPLPRPPMRLLPSHEPTARTSAPPTYLSTDPTAGDEPDDVPGISPFSLLLGRAGAEAGRVSKDNLPAIGGGLAALATGGAALPVVAGAAALGGGAGRLAQQQMEQGAHVPTSADAQDAALTGAWEGGTQLAGGLAGKAIAAAAPALTKAAGRVSSSALKVKDALVDRNPGLNIPLEAAKRGARISSSGKRALNEEIGALSGQVDDAIAQSPATIRPSDAAMDARELLRARKALGPVAAREAAPIRDEIREFVGKNEPVSAEKMQDVKQFLQDKVKKRYGSPDVPARVDAQKALGSGTRKAIERAVPAVAAPNAEMSKLIPVRDAVKSALRRKEKWDLAQAFKLGSGSVFGAGVGFLAGGPGGAAAGAPLTAAALRMLDNPNNKMRIASTLYSAGKNAGGLGDAVSVLGPLIARVAQMKAAGDLSDDETDALVDTIFEDAAEQDATLDPTPVSVLPPLRTPVAATNPLKVPAALKGSSPRGQLEPGNIDLNRRPVVKNSDGTISTVRSMSINVDGREILIPTVSDDGRVMRDEDAIAQFERTGRHLGVFDSPASATAFAEQLHNTQARKYGRTPPLRRP